MGGGRPINYQKENLFETLRAEYPKGVDVVYESVGGQVVSKKEPMSACASAQCIAPAHVLRWEGLHGRKSVECRM